MQESFATINLIATAFMTGLIWFVQIVHYPLFSFIPKEQIQRYEEKHVKWTTFVVLPVMFLELGTSIAMLWWRPLWLSIPVVWVLVLLLILIWMSTFLLQVPCHEKLLKDPSSFTITRLVRTNWIRTVLWSARLLILAWALLSR